MGHVCGHLPEGGDPLRPPERFSSGQQLIVAGCQLRVPERQVPRGLVDLFAERVVERLQLIEHLVQAGGDGSKLVIVADRRPSAQIALRRPFHRAQNRVERSSQQLADGEVHEDGHEQDGRNDEAQSDRQRMLARLQQAFQTDADGHGVAPVLRQGRCDRQYRTAAVAQGRSRLNGPASKIDYLCLLFCRSAGEDAGGPRLIGLDDRDRIDQRLRVHEVVEPITDVTRVERFLACGEIVSD